MSIKLKSTKEHSLPILSIIGDAIRQPKIPPKMKNKPKFERISLISS